MTFSIKPATIEEKPVINALLQPYLDEFSRFPGEHPDYKDNKGVYQYPYLDAYWQENIRFPYLLTTIKTRRALRWLEKTRTTGKCPSFM